MDPKASVLPTTPQRPTKGYFELEPLRGMQLNRQLLYVVEKCNFNMVVITQGVLRCRIQLFLYKPSRFTPNANFAKKTAY